MGTTFANLQVRASSADALPGLPSDIHAYHLADGWITLLSDEFEIGNVQKIARKLSKSFDMPILCVEYFDDDILLLNVFSSGKPVASHVTSNGYGPAAKTGKAEAFVRELGLPADTVGYWKCVLKCEDLWKKMSMLEALLACPIWIDERALCEMGEDNFKKTYDLCEVMEYVDSVKKTEQVRNQTQVNLLYESDSYLDVGSNHEAVILIAPSENGRYYSAMRKLFIPDGQGRLTRFFTKDICFNADVFSTKCISDDRRYIGVHDIFEHKIEVMDNEGNIMGIVKVSDTTVFIALLPDMTIICTKGDTVGRMNLDGDWIWKSAGGYVRILKVHNDRIYMLRNVSNRINSNTEIVCFSLDGEKICSVKLPPIFGCSWNDFILDSKNRLFFVYGIEGEYFLFQYNADLVEIGRTKLVYASIDGIYDDQNGRIYINLLDRGIIAYDVATLSQVARLPKSEELYLSCIDRKRRLVVRKGNSTLEVYNTNLELVSRHKLKGMIYDRPHSQQGNPYFLTTSCKGDPAFFQCDDIGEYASVRDCSTRIYELSDADEAE